MKEKTQGATSDAMTGSIIECVIKVHKALGPGFPKDIYRNALVIELKNAGLTVEPEKELTVQYDGQPVGKHRLDVLVEDRVILDVQTVDKLRPGDYARLRSYLRAAGLSVGLLLNFALEKSDFRRVET